LAHCLRIGIALIASMSASSVADAQEASAPGLTRQGIGVRPGDKLRLTIWREPDLSGDFLVDEDGIVVLPKVGRIDVLKLSTDSLKTLLVARYSESLRDPSVQVTVLRRVNVLGKVRNPGLYHVDLTTTVGDVLALAGGVSSDGNENRIELVRGGRRQPVRLSPDWRLADSPIQSGDQLFVAERSWFARNSGLVAAAVTGAALVFAALIR
jgi:polysaccharide biosynthesis/export protein